MERRFFLQLVTWTFGVVFAVLGANYFVDPFALNERFELGIDRDRVVRPYHNRLYKLAQQRNHPARRIVLGDSRCDRLEAEDFAAAGEPGVRNLSFGGGTLREALATLEWARGEARSTGGPPLEHVLLCIPFQLFDESATLDQVHEAIALMDAPVTYYLSTLTGKASIASVVFLVTGRVLRDETPPLDREGFWRFQLDVSARETHRRWRRPAALLDALRAGVAAARGDGTALTLLVPPNHVDLQATVARDGLEAEYAWFKDVLPALGPMLDMDFPNELTRDAARYGDPYHLTADAAREAAREIVQGGERWIRRIPARDR